ncbi:hypothetical protein FRC17_002797 [Serendipita sp. 399]|nr:hypothetical protein FRC17_002797 [Serendipita sp. 399]
MSGDITRSNLLPTGKEAHLLNALRDQKSNELALIDERMAKDQLTVTACDLAIGKLEKSLTKAREMHRVYQDHSTNIKNTLRTLSFSSTRTVVQPDAPEPCKELSTLLGHEIPDREKKLRAESLELAIFCDKLEITIGNLEEELRCTHHTKAVALETLQAAKNHRADIQGLVDNIRSCFRAIKKVPTEVWAEIFRLRVEEDNRHFLAEDCLERKSTALTLSHVCQPWRRIALGTPQLWETAHWRSGPNGNVKPDMIASIRDRANDRPFTVVASHGQLFPSSLPSTHDVLTISQSLQEYTLHLLVERAEEKMAAPLYQPIFFSPSALTVQVQSAEPLRSTFLYRNLVSSFSNMKKLTFINFFPALAFSEPFRQLTYLKIDTVTDQKPYNLGQLLVESLEELHLAHNGPSNLPSLGHAISLPNLKRLGITPLEHVLLGQLRLPALTDLTIVYPRVDTDVDTAPWIKSVGAVLSNVTALRFDWTNAPSVKASTLTEPLSPTPVVAPVVTSTIDMLSVLRKLQPYATHLEELDFIDGSLHGVELSGFLDEVLEVSAVIFKKVTIERCIGISRTDCERLSQQVEKLKVIESE